MENKTRGFELVEKYSHNKELLPTRETAKSAGYDLKSAETITIKPNEIKLVPTGVKAYMMNDEVLHIHDRSSNPKRLGVVLINSVGVIDSDYYNNPSNEGLIYAQFKNITDKEVTILENDRIAQGVFSKFLITDNDNATGSRLGGFGSTSK